MQSDLQSDQSLGCYVENRLEDTPGPDTTVDRTGLEGRHMRGRRPGRGHLPAALKSGACFWQIPDSCLPNLHRTQMPFIRSPQAGDGRE